MRFLYHSGGTKTTMRVEAPRRIWFGRRSGELLYHINNRLGSVARWGQSKNPKPSFPHQLSQLLNGTQEIRWEKHSTMLWSSPCSPEQTPSLFI
jgi:hypothetical protein